MRNAEAEISFDISAAPRCAKQAPTGQHCQNGTYSSVGYNRPGQHRTHRPEDAEERYQCDKRAKQREHERERTINEVLHVLVNTFVRVIDVGATVDAIKSPVVAKVFVQEIVGQPLPPPAPDSTLDPDVVDDYRRAENKDAGIQIEVFPVDSLVLLVQCRRECPGNIADNHVQYVHGDHEQKDDQKQHPTSFPGPLHVGYFYDLNDIAMSALVVPIASNRGQYDWHQVLSI